MRKKDLKVKRLNRNTSYIDCYEVQQQFSPSDSFETITIFFDRSKAVNECLNRLMFNGIYKCKVVDSRVWL